MSSLNGRVYATLKMHNSTHAVGYGGLGPNIDASANKNGCTLTLTRVDGGVLVNFGKKGVPDFLIESNLVMGGSLLPEGATADKALIITKPAPPKVPGNPVAPGIPGNSGGGMGQPTEVTAVAGKSAWPFGKG